MFAFYRLLFSHVIDEIKVITVTIIFIMMSAFDLNPTMTIVGKKAVSVFGGIFYLGETKTVGNVQCLAIDMCSTYDKYILVVTTML